MAVSAKTLFHFTSKEKLTSILKSGFFPVYSKEDLSSIIPVKKKLHVPMVCFCDLLLSQIGAHIDFYGHYGIGLKKSWGRAKGISPIFYVPKKSVSARHIQTVVTHFIELQESMASVGRTSGFKEVKTSEKEIVKDLPNVIKYIKAFKGKAKNKKTGKERLKTFYDEREWRYSPNEFAVLPDDTPSEVIDSVNELMKVKRTVKFKLSDIKYIIVANEEEIPEFIRIIEKELKLDKSDEASLKILTSRLFCAKQIREDIV